MTEADTIKKTAPKRKVATAKKTALESEKANVPAKPKKNVPSVAVSKKASGADAPAKSRDIGIDVKPPQTHCDDINCPFHGKLPVRGQLITGVIVSNKMQKGVVVKREYELMNKKYERYEKNSNRYSAHCPPCIDSSIGRKVKIMECRPLAKSITYVVIETSEK